MSEAFNTETITHCGITVKIEYFYDQDMGRPWEESDGHGVIREADNQRHGRYAKKPGEVLFHTGRGHYGWVYDIQETTKIAKRDGWGVANPPAGLTKKQITALAVQNDINYCQGWLNDDWHYVGVVCTVLDSDGEETEETESCWGFESLDDYHETAGREMAEALAESTYKARLHQWRSALSEARARKYWASRDVVTVGALHA
jgi:hypothetical protein